MIIIQKPAKAYFMVFAGFLCEEVIVVACSAVVHARRVPSIRSTIMSQGDIHDETLYGIVCVYNNMPILRWFLVREYACEKIWKVIK